MSNKALPVVGTSGVQTVTADESVSADSIPKRDSSGDLAAGNNVVASVGLKTSGFLKLKVQSKSANFSVDQTSGSSSNGAAFVVDTSGASVTVTLSSVASSADIVYTFIKSSGSNSLIIKPATSETIGGSTSTKTATSANSTYTLTCDGSGWYAIGSIGSWS